MEKAACDNERPRGTYEALLKEYHLQARKWEVSAAEPRQDGLPDEIGVLLDRGDFPRLTDDEYGKLGPWLTANARKVYHDLDPANVAKTGRIEEAKKRLRAILRYNASLRQARAPPGETPAGEAVLRQGERQAQGSVFPWKRIVLVVAILILLELCVAIGAWRWGGGQNLLQKIGSCWWLLTSVFAAVVLVCPLILGRAGWVIVKNTLNPWRAEAQ